MAQEAGRTIVKREKKKKKEKNLKKTITKRIVVPLVVDHEPQWPVLSAIARRQHVQSRGLVAGAFGLEKQTCVRRDNIEGRQIT